MNIVLSILAAALAIFIAAPAQAGGINPMLFAGMAMHMMPHRVNRCDEWRRECRPPPPRVYEPRIYRPPVVERPTGAYGGGSYVRSFHRREVWERHVRIFVPRREVVVHECCRVRPRPVYVPPPPPPPPPPPRVIVRRGCGCNCCCQGVAAIDPPDDPPGDPPRGSNADNLPPNWHVVN